jgi:hypothetical protein
MHRFLLPATIGLVGALTLACGDRTTEPTSTPPVFASIANSGASVVRFETVVAAYLTTEESGLTVLAGVSAAELASLCAGGEPSFEPATQLDVFRPDGSLHTVLKGPDLTMLVWREAFADICTPPFASGTGTFMYVDNDVFVSGNRSNSFGFRINGDVSSLGTGQRYHVTAEFHAVIFRNGVFRSTRSDIRLTPRG